MRKKVLIVDDQKGIRELFSEVFRNEGYEVWEASDGTRAKYCILKYQPHLVILDMKLPGISGMDVLKWINKASPSTQVITITAYAELNDIEEARNLGVVALLPKPFEITEILTIVKECLNNN